MTKLPSYVVKSEPADRNLRYLWDDSNTEIAEGKTDTSLVDRLGHLSVRANAAYALALSEWILGRFRNFSGIEAAYQYVECCRATAIDLRYCRMVWDDYPQPDKWEDPVRGPIGLAMFRLQGTMEFIVDEYTEYTASKLWSLAAHVSSNMQALEKWNDLVLDRLQQRYPRLSEDPLGDVVPAEFFDPDKSISSDETEGLIDRFLRSLNPSQNPFLETPEQMIKNEFPGIPYRFDLELDRTLRHAK